MKHEKGFGCFPWFPRLGWDGSGKANNEARKRGWVVDGSQEWGGKGLGRLKLVPKGVVGMVWERQK